MPIAEWSVAHTNITVPDLEEAMERFTADWGLTWSPVVDFSGMELVSPLRDEPVSSDGVRAVFSQQAPRLELVEAPAGGIWATPDRKDRLHHIAFWIDDLAKEAAALVAAGWGLELTVAPGDEARGMAYLLSSQGMRIELLEVAQKPAFEDWASGNTEIVELT